MTQSLTPSELTLAPRAVKLTTRSGIDIQRLLPHRDIRMIGAWCFLDYYGPTHQRDAMNVAAHPHAGLQTVSWLFSGAIDHHDSLGSEQRIIPGELNLMTADSGIAHSELSVTHGEDLHGVQLWIALPAEFRKMEAKFSHFDSLPSFFLGQLNLKVIIGEFGGHSSPAEHYSQLTGVELNFTQSERQTLPLKPEWEYGLLVINGKVFVNNNLVPHSYLHYIPTGSTEVALQADGGAAVILLGGEPFPEEIIMWWNFIARFHEEIVEMRLRWESGSAPYQPFNDDIGGRIPAPAMPNLILTPRGSKRTNN